MPPASIEPASDRVGRGSSNLANLLEENEPQVLGHRYAQRALVGRHGRVLAPFAFCKSRGRSGRVETDAQSDPLAVNPPAQASRRIGRAPQPNRVPLQRFGEGATLTRHLREELFQARVLHVFRCLGVTQLAFTADRDHVGHRGNGRGAMVRIELGV